MTDRMITEEQLGSLTKVGQGGQGVVYRAPKVKTKFATSMVFKEYKRQALAEIDFTALASMQALVEEQLSYTDAEKLISIAAWPCALVEKGGRPCGFVMPSIPENFFVSLTTVKGESQATAEFQHLLNHSSVLAARGISVTEAQRYALLRETASALAFLHKIGVWVGDISPKNLLFSLVPREAVYFIDCDAMRVNGVSAMAQAETPGWEVPPGEEPATIYSDTYKLGLLALRLLIGDQDARDIQRLPPTTPSMLRKIISDTLTNEPERRPLPEAWTFVLGHAVEEAQHRQAATPMPSHTDEPPPPPAVQVRTRPQRAITEQTTGARTQTLTVANGSAPPSDARWVVAIIAVVAGVSLVIVLLVVFLNRGGGESAQPTRRSNPDESTYTTEETTIDATTTTTARTTTRYTFPFQQPPALVRGPDLRNDARCINGAPLSVGHGRRAGPGRYDTTSCEFAINVGESYWGKQLIRGPGYSEGNCAWQRAMSPNRSVGMRRRQLHHALRGQR